MKKLKKVVYAVTCLLALFSLSGCLSTSLMDNQIVNTLVDNNIITLPSINLDFVNNSKIELTQSLLNKWNNTAPDVVSELKQRLDFKSNIKHYLSQQLPSTDDYEYFPINVEGLGLVYVISQFL